MAVADLEAETWLTQVNEQWAKNKEERYRRLKAISQLVAHHKEKTPPQWYVNSQTQTMVVIPGPVEFRMGSPKTEEGRYEEELQHVKRIGRSFAIAAKSVTWEQFLKFAPNHKSEREDKLSPSLECPVNSLSWPLAAEYCNWLSKEDGIDESQWCYTFKGKEPTLRKNYLSLTGYRLPTEAEMEYANVQGH